MAKRLQEYVKYTQTELDSYVSTPGSCVHKINSNRHYALDPYVLSDLKSSLPAYILKHEISYYDAKLQGVLLAVKNIKVLNGVASLRSDDSHLHIDINADCYVFRPEEGAELAGVVKHIGKHRVSVVLYRVFNAHITFRERIDKEQLTMGQELKFRVRSFGINGIFLNINGELLTSPVSENELSTTKKANKIIFADEEPEHGTPDSGIEEENKLIELDELLRSIKNEPLSDEEFPDTSKQKKNAVKRKRKKSESFAVAVESVVLESEPGGSSGKKRKRKSSIDSAAFPAVKTEFA